MLSNVGFPPTQASWYSSVYWWGWLGASEKWEQENPAGLWRPTWLHCAPPEAAHDLMSPSYGWAVCCFLSSENRKRSKHVGQAFSSLSLDGITNCTPERFTERRTSELLSSFYFTITAAFGSTWWKLLYLPGTVRWLRGKGPLWPSPWHESDLQDSHGRGRRPSVLWPPHMCLGICVPHTLTWAWGVDSGPGVGGEGRNRWILSWPP